MPNKSFLQFVPREMFATIVGTFVLDLAGVLLALEVFVESDLGIVGLTARAAIWRPLSERLDPLVGPYVVRGFLVWSEEVYVGMYPDSLHVVQDGFPAALLDKPRD